MGTVILTSTGLSSEIAKKYFLDIVSKLSYKKGAYVTTAAKDKESNKWSIISKQQMLDLGLNEVDFVDIEVTPNFDFSTYDVVMVAGGNTFKLLNAVNNSNFKNEMKNFLSRGGIYIGISAGAIIMTPTISIAGEVEPDVNEIGITDLSGMGFVPFEVLPHYESYQDPQIEEYKKKTANEVKLISNEEILIFNL